MDDLLRSLPTLIFVILCDSVVLLFVKFTWLPPENACWRPGSSSCWDRAVGDDGAAVVQYSSCPWSEGGSFPCPILSCPILSLAISCMGLPWSHPRPCQGGKLPLAFLLWELSPPGCPAAMAGWHSPVEPCTWDGPGQFSPALAEVSPCLTRWLGGSCELCGWRSGLSLSPWRDEA